MVDDMHAAEYLKGFKPEYARPDMSIPNLVQSFAKYHKPSPVLNPQQRSALDLATTWATLEFRPHLLGGRLTPQKVISMVEMKKSPGFPWTSKYSSAETVWEEHRDWIEGYVAAADRSIPVACPVFNVFPKEEILPADKVANGKLRSISGCPLEFKVLANTIFLEQNEKFYAGAGKCASEVGINQFGGGWNQLYHKLSKPGWLALATDISGMDANMSLDVSRAIYQVRWECYDATQKSEHLHDLVRWCHDVIFTGYSVLPDGGLFRKDHGNSSGSPNTVVDNTIGLYIALCYSWIRSCQAIGVEPRWEDFIDNVTLALYGDDNLCTASALGRRVFEPQALTKAFGELGWQITFDFPDWDILDKQVFLMRGFHLEDGFAYPKPVDGNKALSSLLLKGRKQQNPASTYERACGLLLIYYWDPLVRRTLSGFLDYLEGVYFAANTKENLQLRKQRLTDVALRRLYGDPDWAAAYFIGGR